MPHRPLDFSTAAFTALAGTSLFLPSFPPAKGQPRARRGSVGRLRTLTANSLPLSLGGAGQRRCRGGTATARARPQALGGSEAPVPQGPPQSSPADAHSHSPARWTTILPAPREGSPSLTSCSCFLWLWAAGVHVHQELGQAPHTGTEDSATARGTAGRLRALQVLTQQPGQGADAVGVCEANQTQSGVPPPRARRGRARESAGYLGW